MILSVIVGMGYIYVCGGEEGREGRDAEWT